MKYLETYKIFESGSSNVQAGSMAEEIYFLFVDYADKYDLEWTKEEGGFGFNDNISEYIISENSECVVLDIHFQVGFGLAGKVEIDEEQVLTKTWSNRGKFKISDEFNNDMLEFAKRIEACGYKKPRIRYYGNDSDYKGSLLYQISIEK